MRAPVLAVGDGALGFWAALREVFPETGKPRCWARKIKNVLNYLPKSAQHAARRALKEIRDAETAIRDFERSCQLGPTVRTYDTTARLRVLRIVRSFSRLCRADQQVSDF